MDVVNLIPVKPLAEDEPVFLQSYESKLKGLYEKIKAYIHIMHQKKKPG